MERLPMLFSKLTCFIDAWELMQRRMVGLLAEFAWWELVSHVTSTGRGNAPSTCSSFLLEILSSCDSSAPSNSATLRSAKSLTCSIEVTIASNLSGYPRLLWQIWQPQFLGKLSQLQRNESR